jgi:hypothetical protein
MDRRSTEPALARLSDAWGREGLELECAPVAWRLPADRAGLGALLDGAPAEAVELMDGAHEPGDAMPAREPPRPLSRLLDPRGPEGWMLRLGPLESWAGALVGWREAWRALLERFAGPRAAERADVRFDLYLAPPGVCTRFHADPSHNFLHQVRGERVLQLFSPADERLIDAETRPKVYLLRGEYPRYRAECEDRARSWRLAAPRVVYVPARAGHWIRNGPELSVSYTVSLRLPADLREKHCHAMNRRLAGLGLGRSPYGRRPWLDALKAWTEVRIRALSRSRPRD